QHGEHIAAPDGRAVGDDPNQGRGTAHGNPATPGPDLPVLELALDDGSLRTLDPAAGDHRGEQVGPAHAGDPITLAGRLLLLTPAHLPESQASECAHRADDEDQPGPASGRSRILLLLPLRILHGVALSSCPPRSAGAITP